MNFRDLIITQSEGFMLLTKSNIYESVYLFEIKQFLHRQPMNMLEKFKKQCSAEKVSNKLLGNHYYYLT